MSKWDRTKGRPEPIRALNRVNEVENGEPLVHLAEAAPSVLIHRDSVIPYLRKSVAEMLERAAQTLAGRYRLGVVDAWRPLARQQRIYSNLEKFLDEARPGLSHARKRRVLCRWVAPTDQKAPPGHCTGAAVDVWPVDEAGEDVDVYSPFTRFQAAPTYMYGLSPQAHENRMALVEAMLGAGFSNCRDEWWHYSYGDAGWAVRMGLDECCYGKVELEPSFYQAQEEEWIRLSSSRTNPFLEERP